MSLWRRCLNQIEVKDFQYHCLMSRYKGIVCGLEKENKYWIKIWDSKYYYEILNYLKT